MSGAEERPYIRGAVRADLIADLALGELSLAQLAEKYERSVEAIHKFQTRNRDEIRQAKQAIVDEDRGLTHTRLREKLAQLEQYLSDIEEQLQDPEMTHTARKGYYGLAVKLLHLHSDLSGQLPVRTQVEVSGAGFSLPPPGTKWVPISDGQPADS
jgi:hypothetical protein